MKAACRYRISAAHSMRVIKTYSCVHSRDLLQLILYVVVCRNILTGLIVSILTKLFCDDRQLVVSSTFLPAPDYTRYRYANMPRKRKINNSELLKLKKHINSSETD